MPGISRCLVTVQSTASTGTRLFPPNDSHLALSLKHNHSSAFPQFQCFSLKGYFRWGTCIVKVTYIGAVSHFLFQVLPQNFMYLQKQFHPPLLVLTPFGPPGYFTAPCQPALLLGISLDYTLCPFLFISGALPQSPAFKTFSNNASVCHLQLREGGMTALSTGWPQNQMETTVLRSWPCCRSSYSLRIRFVREHCRVHQSRESNGMCGVETLYKKKEIPHPYPKAC